MLKQETSANSAEQRSFDNPAGKRSWAIGFTSIFFALLQSACTAFMAISGLRLLIGVGSLAAATMGLRFLDALARRGYPHPHGNRGRCGITGKSLRGLAGSESSCATLLAMENDSAHGEAETL